MTTNPGKIALSLLLLSILFTGCKNEKVNERNTGSDSPQNPSSSVELDAQEAESSESIESATRVTAKETADPTTDDVDEFISIGAISVTSGDREKTFSMLNKAEVRFFISGDVMMHMTDLWCDPQDKDKVIALFSNLSEEQQYLFKLNPEPFTRWKDWLER